MDFNRRSLLRSAIWLPLAFSAGTLPTSSRGAVSGPRSFKRIATEEAFSTPEIVAAQLDLLINHPETEPGFAHLWENAMGGADGAVGRMASALGGRGTVAVGRFFHELSSMFGGKGLSSAITQLTDVGRGRLRVMDETGIAMQLLSLSAPGVQVFDAETGTALARSANDRLAEVVRKHPSRFAGLAAIAPQDPDGAARELERSVKELGLKGAVINSHTKGEYLDEPKFRPILAKAEELDVPIYLHPRTPSPEMIRPFQKYVGLEAATFGFAVEAGLHALRMILGGVFDDHPGLTIVLGHLGEGLPFWIDRIDNRSRFFQEDAAEMGAKTIRKRPSEYLRENFYITTSGMDFEPALLLAHRVVGPDRILFAVDHPYEDGTNLIRVLDRAPISDEDREKIYHANAERIFRL